MANFVASFYQVEEIFSFLLNWMDEILLCVALKQGWYFVV